MTLRQIHNLLAAKNKTVAVAESCTGGLVSKLLTDLSGSSKYFTAGFVTYSNLAKIGILKIPAKVIAQKGAVSKETACLMAQSAKKIVKADFGMGITGIAGPTGGSLKKPVGTVFIAIDSKDKKVCRKFRFTGTRAAIRKKAALKALELLKITLHRLQI
jgi:PncC family amidohydrolase